MSEPGVEHLSLAEFLDWDIGDDRRYELVDGVPVAMALPSVAHGILVATIGRHLAGALDLRPPCRAHVAAGIAPLDRTDTYHQADLAVTCAPRERGQVLTLEPLVVIEVVSPSTEDRDRKVKLPDYRALPTVAEVVLIDSEWMYCEVHRRFDESRWLGDLLRSPEAVLRLESIGFAQPLAVLYANVPLAVESA
jgi:Uma2 family endonuclease